MKGYFQMNDYEKYFRDLCNELETKTFKNNNQIENIKKEQKQLNENYLEFFYDTEDQIKDLRWRIRFLQVFSIILAIFIGILIGKMLIA